MMKLLAVMFFVLGATVCGSIKVRAQNLPDLAVTSVTWSNQPVAGQYLTVAMTVTNLGNASANAAWNDAWVLSTNETLQGAVAGAFLAGASHTLPTNASYSITYHDGFGAPLHLPNVPAGDYYLIGVANYNHSLVESNYTNNTLAVPITLAIPDLAVTSVTWSNQPVAGQFLTVAMTVTNLGNGSANAAWNDAWVLSTNETLQGAVAGAFLAGASHTLPINGSYSITYHDGFGAPLHLPNVPAGDYYLIGVANYDHSLVESNYANNTLAVPIKLAIPDLAVTSVTWSNQPVAGQLLSVAMTVTNLGNGPANAAWNDAWVLSTNDTLQGAVAGAFQAGASHTLPTNGSYSITYHDGFGAPLHLPNVPAGDYYLIGVANYEHSLVEGNYTNNTLAVPITLAIPDLAVTSVTWSNKPVAGQLLSVAMTVTNIGNGFANSSWNDAWVLSSNATLQGAVASAFRAGASHTLPANGSYSLTYHDGFGSPLLLPNVPAGDYYLIGVANYEQSLVESNYSNNTLAVAITLRSTDLAATNFSVGSPAIAGLDLSLSFNVFNVSTNAYSSYWYDGVTLSSNASLAGAITNWSWYGYHSLPPGSNYVQTQTIQLPGVAAGTNYYLIAEADDHHGVSDNDTNNNLQILQLAITNLPPSISLLLPTNTAQQTSCIPASFTLFATVQLNSYPVTNVTFYDGTNVLGVKTNPPYRMRSPLLDHGDHVITARATDKFSLTSDSPPATASVVWPSQPNVLRIDPLSNDCVICMAALNGSNYLVQTTTNLGPSILWTPLVTNLVIGTNLVVTNHPTGPERFFRAVLLQ